MPSRSHLRLNRKIRASDTHASRITMTPTRTASTNTVIRVPVSSEFCTSVRIRWACSPISRKTVFSSRNWIVVQFTRSLSRDWPDWISGDL